MLFNKAETLEHYWLNGNYGMTDNFASLKTLNNKALTKNF